MNQHPAPAAEASPCVNYSRCNPVHPAVPCGSCAFNNSGDGARKEVSNVLMGEICAYAGRPFLCHHAADGRELDWSGSEKEYLDSMAGRKDFRLCAGWKARVRELKAKGHFPKDPLERKIQRAAGEVAILALHTFTSKGVSKKEKQAAHTRLGDMLVMLKLGE